MKILVTKLDHFLWHFWPLTFYVVVQIAKLLTESLKKADEMNSDSLFHYQENAAV